MRTGERGYALLLAIAVIAVLAFVVLVSAHALADVTAATTRLQEQQREYVAAESVAARVAFLVMTHSQDVAHAGGGDQHATPRLYGALHPIQGVNGAYVSVQDEAGLFNLNSTDEQSLSALLVLGGAGERSPQLAATLMDYTDGDDLVRDGGGEAREYSRLGLPLPADHPIASRWQALEAIGWRDAGLQRGEFWKWLTASATETGLNVNTAPQAVLQAVLGDRRRAEAIVRRRQASPLTDLAEVEALTSGAARANGVTFTLTPGRAFRVQAVFGSHGPRHGIERRLLLADADGERPFKWVEEREVSLAPMRDGETANSLSLDPSAP